MLLIGFTGVDGHPLPARALFGFALPPDLQDIVVCYHTLLELLDVPDLIRFTRQPNTIGLLFER